MTRKITQESVLTLFEENLADLSQNMRYLPNFPADLLAAITFPQKKSQNIFPIPPVFSPSNYKMNILKNLSRPFPEEGNFKKQLRSFAGVAFFIFAVLYFMRPFGLTGGGKSLLLVTLGFGLVSFVVPLLYYVLFAYVLKIKRNVPGWTLGKWILYMLGLLLCISFGNFSYVLWLYPGYTAFDWHTFLNMAYATVSLGLIPVFFTGFVIQRRAERLNTEAATAIQKRKPPLPEEQAITLVSYNEKQTLTAKESEILWLESRQNYVTVFHLKDDAITETTLRNTLKSMGEQLPPAVFLRCHQSFIVNTDLIEKAEGNAQGLRLTLRGGAGTEVPVSRRYVNDLRAVTG